MIFEGNEPRFSISCTPEAVCETLGNSRSTNSFCDPVYYIRNNGRRVIVTFHGENPLEQTNVPISISFPLAEERAASRMRVLSDRSLLAAPSNHYRSMIERSTIKKKRKGTKKEKIKK